MVARRFEETVLRRQILYSGRVISLRRDEVKLPNGRKAFREVVEHPGAVTIVPFLDEETLVMVRQYREAVSKSLLELPAGTLRAGESPAECASRELVEETGYEAKQLDNLIDFYVAPGYSTERIYAFVGRQLSQRAQSTDEDEFIDVVEVPLKECFEMIKGNEIMDAKTICSLAAISLNKSVPP